MAKKFECVITCLNYSDFLTYTLPWIDRQFDYIVVVTTPEDIPTQQICDAYNIHCVKTRAFYDGGTFCKGKGINAGLAALSKSDWVVHLDADIALPRHARRALEFAELDPLCLYGIDRVNCRSYEDWARFLASPFPQHEKDVFLHLGAFPPGARVVKSEAHGYCPIGFFQMWNPTASGFDRYPDEHTDAGRGDVIFAMQWPRVRRLLLPEIIAYHLESAAVVAGTNWNGRKTPRFGPDPLPSQLRFNSDGTGRAPTQEAAPAVIASPVAPVSIESTLMESDISAYQPTPTPVSVLSTLIFGVLVVITTVILVSVPGLSLFSVVATSVVDFLSLFGLILFYRAPATPPEPVDPPVS